MLANLSISPFDMGLWYRLTDEYAAALWAMERGEPAARDRVQQIYAQLHQTLLLNEANDVGFETVT